MEEIVETIVTLARKVGELMIENKELREGNDVLKRTLESMRLHIKADADATETVAKK